jgi:hypothetical protein
MRAMLQGTDQHLLAAFGPPPRFVFRTGGVSVPIRMILFLLIPHVWIGFFLIWQAMLEPAMTCFGHNVKASIVSRQLIHAKATRCKITYAYDDEGGHHTGSATFGGDRFSSYPPGGKIEVRTLRLGPWSTSRLADRASNSSLVCMLPFTVLWNGIFAWIFYQLCLSPLRQRRLISIGQPVVGRITDKTLRKGKSPTHILLYVYTAADGQDHTSRMTVPGPQYFATRVEDPVIVFHDPLKPGRSLLYKYTKYAVQDRFGGAVETQIG